MKFIDFHTHKLLSENSVVSIINQYPEEALLEGQLVSVGIHPWFVDAKPLGALITNVEKKANNKNTVAIGEIGLDKLNGPSIDVQQRAFEMQVQISEKLRKPVILHCVRAYSEILSLKKYIQPQMIWIMHGFRGKYALAEQLLRAGMYLSFGGALLKNDSLQETLKKIPNDRFFLETDESDHKIQVIYEKAAAIKKIGERELKTLMKNNFEKVFGQSLNTD